MSRFSISWLVVRSYFFFFQAEDGIRDLYVTGVQTCALPISRASELLALPKERRNIGLRLHAGALGLDCRIQVGLELVNRGLETSAFLDHAMFRSEERRVGKEWRSWGAA